MAELSYIQISPNDPRSVLPTYWLVLGKYHLNTPPRANVTSHHSHQLKKSLFIKQKLLSVSTMWIPHTRIINLSLIGLAFPLN